MLRTTHWSSKWKTIFKSQAPCIRYFLIKFKQIDLAPVREFKLFIKENILLEIMVAAFVFLFVGTKIEPL